MYYSLLILSDSHLFGSREQKLFGVNTYHSLAKLTNHIRGLGQVFDLVVASGDLSEDGQTRAYEDFHMLTKGLASNTVWMKGNHDLFDNVPVEFKNIYFTPEWHMDPWSIIFLDTTLTGKDEGVLDQAELHRLETFLQSNNEKHVLIFMHHQPIDVGSDFIDVLGLQNKKEFLELISKFQNVRGIFFGHVHQVFDGQFNGIRMISSPSTSMQFKPHSSELKFDKQTHGYRTITLNHDGSMDTKIHRIAAEN